MVKTGIDLNQFIIDDHNKLKDKCSYVSFRFYVGINGNTVESFGYPKGFDVDRWYLATAKYSRVYGPFKTKTAATQYITQIQ